MICPEEHLFLEYIHLLFNCGVQVLHIEWPVIMYDENMEGY
jgi:hypothetical protein